MCGLILPKRINFGYETELWILITAVIIIIKLISHFEWNRNFAV